MCQIPARIVVLFIVLSLFTACANVVPPSGGKNDVTPPKLLRITPQDSLLNTRVTRIEMKFDEYVTVSDVPKELHISPTLAQSPVMTVSGKTVVIKIQDSLLQENTTYTLSLGKAIKDLHEGNSYTGKSFLFSTGSWFDSLKMKGYIMDAATGKRDSSGTVKVLLYDAKLPFDIVTKQKPAYVSTVNGNGDFTFEGLPKRVFRIFALKESDDNLQFDNDEEFIGFSDTTYIPSVDTAPVVLSIFKEIPDSLHVKNENTSDGKFGLNSKAANTSSAPLLDTKSFNYKVIADTGNKERRTQEINKPLEVFISRKVQTLNQHRIALSADSNGVEAEQKFDAYMDTSGMKLSILTLWKPNTLYTLRLLKSFVQDSSNTDAMPSRYIFRTKSEDDYGKMDINIPEKYVRKPYLLQVTREADSVYLGSVISAKVPLTLLTPGIYKIVIIEDKNGDGKWTTGRLKNKLHAEQVIPYSNTIMMKAGWEHTVDFEQKKK